MASAAVQTLKDIIPAIGDEDEALKNLCEVMDNGGLDPGVFAMYVDNIVPRLEDVKWQVRCYAVKVLGNLESGVLAKYADHIIPRLEDVKWQVRWSAVQALSKLESGVLAKYADDISRMLADEEVSPGWSSRQLSAGSRARRDEGSRARRDEDVAGAHELSTGWRSRRPVLDVRARRRQRKRIKWFKMLRGRVWLARWRQLFWCWRFLWWWWGRAWMPGSRQAIAAASEFGRMHRVSVEEEGEREVKRARVV